MVFSVVGCTWIPLFFVDHLVFFHNAGTTWTQPYFATWAFLFGNVFAACGTTWTQPYFATWAFFVGNVFCCLWDHLDPILCLCYYVTCFLYFSYLLIFSNFASDVKAAASRTYGVQLCEKFWLTVFNSRADNTVINYCQSFCKFKAWCLLSSGEFSFLPATTSSWGYTAYWGASPG